MAIAKRCRMKRKEVLLPYYVGYTCATYNEIASELPTPERRIPLSNADAGAVVAEAREKL